MISITKDFASIGRNLGNKLFTYGLARSLSDIYSYALNVPENSYIQRNGIILDFPFKSHDGIKIQDPIFYLSDIYIYEKGLDNVIKNIKDHSTIVDGYFPKYEYIKPFKGQILKIYSSLYAEQDNLNDCIILLRDSNHDPRFKLPNSYYINILNNISFNKLYISYDHLKKHKSLIESLLKFNLILLDLLKFITTKKY
jgi:hypothetical protein